MLATDTSSYLLSEEEEDCLARKRRIEIVERQTRHPSITSATAGNGSSRDVGRHNAALVLQTMLADGPLARATLAERIGLTRGTVTRVTAKLLEINLLQELSLVRMPFGRPMVPLDISTEGRAVATVHLGASEMRIGLVGLRGVAFCERKIPYSLTDPKSMVAVVAEQVKRTVGQELGSRRLLGVGVSIGGWVDSDTGTVVHYAPLNWRNVPLASMLKDALRLPLAFDQMVRGMALAEMMFGSARGTRDFIELYVGNIVGAALIDDGRPRRGPRGAAGIVSHLPIPGASGARCSCGRNDCLESVASDTAVVERARNSGILAADENVYTLIGYARRGNEAAIALLDERAGYLAAASGLIIDLVNPTLLVLAGSPVQTPRLLEVFQAALTGASERTVGDTVPVLLSSLGEVAPTSASAALFLDEYYQDPFAYESSPLS